MIYSERSVEFVYSTDSRLKSYSSKEVVKLIEADGWKLIRVEGSHHMFRHGNKKGTVVVPHPKKDLPIKTALSIFKQAGIEVR